MPVYSDSDISKWRDAQFPSLQQQAPQSIIYLDHAGAPLIPRSLAERACSDLISAIPFNPHSNFNQKNKIEIIREATLKFFGANESKFSLVWTSGATAALKLLGGCVSVLTSQGLD